MFFLKLAPFVGFSLAAVSGKQITTINKSTSLYGLNEDAIITSLENANATATGQEYFSDSSAAKNPNALSWGAIIKIAVAANVPIPKTDDIGDDQVIQLTGFSVTSFNQSVSEQFPADVCVTLVQGLSDKLTERAQDWENNSCDMIPDECDNELRSRAQNNINPKGCSGTFSLPSACQDAFPGGKVTSFTMQTDRLPEGGYFFAKASPPTESGSKNASDAYAENVKQVWPIYISSQQIGGLNVDNTETETSLRCLRAHQFWRGSVDPNKEQHDTHTNVNITIGEDNDDPGSGVDRAGSLSLPLALTAFAAVLFLA